MSGRRRPGSRLGRRLRGQVALGELCDDCVQRVDDVGHAHHGHLRQELKGIGLGEAVLGLEPAHELHEGDAEGVGQGPRAPRHHQVLGVLEARPVDLPALHETEPEGHVHGRLEAGAAGLAVAHGPRGRRRSRRARPRGKREGDTVVPSRTSEASMLPPKGPGQRPPNASSPAGATATRPSMGRRGMVTRLRGAARQVDGARHARRDRGARRSGRSGTPR